MNGAPFVLCSEQHTRTYIDPGYKSLRLVRALGPSSNPLGKTGFHVLCAGIPLDPATFPKSARWYGRKHFLADINTSGHLIYVSDRFREVIEKIEPNVHQFLPIDLSDSKKQLLARRNAMIVCRTIDATDEKAMAAQGWVLRQGVWRLPSDLPKDDPDYKPYRKGGWAYIFDPTKIGSNAMWYDQRRLVRGPHPYVSADLANVLLSASLTGLNLKPVSNSASSID